MELTKEQIEKIQEEVMKTLPLKFSPEVLEEIERINREHSEEWNLIKDRPFTI